MEKRKLTTAVVLGAAIVLAAAIIAATAIYVLHERKSESDKWVLQVYGNAVALYNNNELNEVFSDIVLDTLPPEDVRQLENGISFLTKEEAIRAIEDFDG